MLSAAEELDHCHPRLLIEASPHDYYRWDDILSTCFSLCVFCELLGLSMLLVAATTHFRRNSFDELRLRIFRAHMPVAAALPRSSKPVRSIRWLLILGILMDTFVRRQWPGNSLFVCTGCGATVGTIRNWSVSVRTRESSLPDMA